MGEKAPQSKMQAFLQDLLVGGSLGAFAKTVMSPVERVKILIQTQAKNPDVISGKVKPYTGMGDCFKRVASEQGVKAFWRGNLVNCLRYAPQQGSALALNDFYKNLFPNYNKDKQFWEYFGSNLISGGLGGASAMVVCYPMDFARTRLASDLEAGKGKFNGIIDCLSKTIKAEGITGLYRGTAVSIAGAFVYRAGQLGLFGTVMGFNPYSKDKGWKGVTSAIIVGTAARTVILPFNYPFDTVRRALMLESEKPAKDRMYRSGIDAFGKILKSEGTVGLYRGALPEIYRGLGGVVVVVMYDRVKNWIK